MAAEAPGAQWGTVGHSGKGQGDIRLQSRASGPLRFYFIFKSNGKSLKGFKQGEETGEARNHICIFKGHSVYSASTSEGSFCFAYPIRGVVFSYGKQKLMPRRQIWV